jgi:hypothetical protein
MKSTGYILLLFALLLSCRDRERNSDKIFLELNLAEGERYSLQMEMEQDLDAGNDQGQAFVEQYFRFEIESFVQSAEDARSFQLSNFYRQIVMQQRIETEEDEVVIYIDTDDPENVDAGYEKLLAYYLKLLKIPYHSAMDRQGNILYSDLNEVNEQAGGKEYSSPYQQLFTYGIIYPGYEIDVLDKWEKEISIRDSLLSVTGMMSYQLEAYDEERALISLSGRIKATQKGMNVSGKMELEQLGKVWVWRHSGWIKEAEINQKIRYVSPDQPSESKYIEGKVTIRGKQLK